jgi:S-formylglutathione hydrolase
MEATRRTAIAAFGLAGAAMSAGAPSQAKLETRVLSTAVVPSPVPYSALHPPGAASSAGLPLLLMLHGGNGDNGFLAAVRPAIEAAWAADGLAPCLVVTPDCRRSLYLDYRDGSQRWETFIVSELVPHLRAAYGLAPERERTLVAGISMGGLGALRLGFKHPDVFGGLAALEAGIEPALRFLDVKTRNSFQRGRSFLEERFGHPVDEAWWQANNPADIAIARRDEIAASGLAIYIEVGDVDMFHLDEGVEYLHRVLWDHDIHHEYRLVRGADHLGRTLPWRVRDGLKFLQAHVLAPPPADDTYETGKQMVRRLKREAGVDEAARRPALPPTDFPGSSL